MDLSCILVDSLCSLSLYHSLPVTSSRFVLFAARTGDDQSPRDNEDNASSEENAPEKSESEETKNNDEHKLELQGFGHEREGEQGSDAAESQKRPEARARGTSQDLQKSVEHIIRAERERYSKEEDEDGDKDELQNCLLPSEESGVEAEGLDAVEQQRERRQQTLRVQEVLGRQKDGALVAEFKGRGGGSGMGGVDKVAKGEWTERTLGEEELAGWRTQPVTMPAQQLGEPSEEVRERGRSGSGSTLWGIFLCRRRLGPLAQGPTYITYHFSAASGSTVFVGIVMLSGSGPHARGAAYIHPIYCCQVLTTFLRFFFFFVELLFVTPLEIRKKGGRCSSFSIALIGAAGREGVYNHLLVRALSRIPDCRDESSRTRHYVFSADVPFFGQFELAALKRAGKTQRRLDSCKHQDIRTAPDAFRPPHASGPLARNSPHKKLSLIFPEKQESREGLT